MTVTHTSGEIHAKPVNICRVLQASLVPVRTVRVLALLLDVSNSGEVSRGTRGMECVSSSGFYSKEIM